MNKSIAATAAILLFCSSAWALDNTSANRGQQADRYLEAMPAREMLADLIAWETKDLPADAKRDFTHLVTKETDMRPVERAMKKALVKHFTADELKALADLYCSPFGKSAMKKLHVYMADVSPVIQAEVQKAALARKANEPTTEPESRPGKRNASESKSPK